MATIMMVDDHAEYRSVLRDFCEAAGYAVVEANGGEQALSMLQRAVQMPDLFIVDYHMDMTGYDLIRELRRNETTRDIPAIMLSATAKQIRDVVLQEGVTFLSKCCTNQEIMRSVSEALKKHMPKVEAPKAAAAAKGDAYEVGPLEIVRSHYDSLNQAAPPPLPPSPDLLYRFNMIALPPPEIPAPKPASPAPKPASPDREISRVVDEALKDISKFTATPEHRFEPDAGARVRGAADMDADAGGTAPVGRLLNGILDHAMELGASDIHFEPQAHGLVVRARVHGSMRGLCRLPSYMKSLLASRVKIISGLDIVEKRLPQDGHFTRTGENGRKVEFRVSTLPSVEGEKVVLRLLPSGELKTKLDLLGLSPANLELTSKVLTGSSGIILVAGPTGSGKTTTLYTMLDKLNDPSLNIVTVEDPVEYRMRGITQVQVQPGIGYTFDKVLRALLRQDPDAVLVGEIRDVETALIAMQAAATGHLVLSTVHTNSAAATAHRLISMGVPPYLIAAASRLIISQRLVGLLCPHCKQEGDLTDAQACHLTPEERRLVAVACRPVGCPRCGGIGYSGRRAVFEVMPVLSHEMRQALVREASPDDLFGIAARDGMRSLRAETVDLIAKGLTSVEEAASILSDVELRR